MEVIIFIIKDIFLDFIIKGVVEFFKGNVVFFRGWKKRKEFVEVGLLYPHHRKYSNEKIFWDSFKSRKDITLITIKSLHTRNNLIERIGNGEVSVHSLKILTLNPNLAKPVFISLSKLLNEPVENCIQDIQDAYNLFKELEHKYSFIEVRKYDCIPTLQGIIVSDKSALIELLTYHSNPDERSAFLLTQKDNPVTLQHFAKKIDLLWKEAKQ
ncbi:MAG: hypothetical protein ACYDA4_07355 [Ignavibacteriaceae bacterium]